ncbi:uncharacterized protein BX663DRAFT_551933 [Cokeromyces recurvatus]|uniref:uncharacterized protein n=1 Tax=Cokeromyces recurvatus TaxID=90255 RepID=UPI002220EA45|nr:uncharacterized protein BX663DRAFT_551923 [Cokeromyces recurvatus]XP_051383071.1 uncharacterized protein BX663DRAFT_551933 [Cokeromyces recurvatus]KAI7903075.1 hypothetical protein BX663DRAFT_551923 [Cokeromyces recurvatus]KAI7903086.1 hypothetical protein BX663DRAFT_551933 [Cokeromyces recurvatus]
MTFSCVFSAPRSSAAREAADRAAMPPPRFLPARFGKNVLAAVATSGPVDQSPPDSMEMEDDPMDLVDEVEELGVLLSQIDLNDDSMEDVVFGHIW